MRQLWMYGSNKEERSLFLAFHPKATNSICRQVFWLVRFLSAFPTAVRQSVAKGMSETLKGLTATGIAPEFHNIMITGFPFPYWVNPDMETCNYQIKIK